MSFDEYFTDGDKPYAENLNDAALLLDAFDVTVPCEMPVMFNNGEFNSTVDVARKCGVGIVTLKSVASGITVGTDEISGTGDIVFRVYPNFNSFYKWSKIILEKSGTVSIAFKKTDGTSISATVGSDGTISEAADLKTLQEIDVVFSLTSASITDILMLFVNNQQTRTRTSALFEADQLVNINGTVAEDDLKAVNGDTVNTALNSLHTTINTALDLKEDKSNKVTTLDSSSSHYPSCTAVNTGLNTKENSSNKVTTLDSSTSHYPSCSAVKAVTDNKADKGWTTVTVGNPSLQVNASLRLAMLTCAKWGNYSDSATITLGENCVPSGYRPSSEIVQITNMHEDDTDTNLRTVTLLNNGNLVSKNYGGTDSELRWCSFQALWKY